MAKPQISRRDLFRRAGALAAAGSLSGVIAACSTAQPAEPALPAVLRDPTPPELKYPAVAPPPATLPAPGEMRVFSMQEARTVEALTARILPGTPDDPGAREAGVVIYIDYLLSQNEGFAEPTYRQPPFAQLYSGETPPDSGGYNVIWVAAAEARRYGYQAVLTPREVYRIGVEAVDRYAESRFDKPFAELSEAQQDAIVGELAEGTATGFGQVSAAQFFQVLRRHTAEGMFGDPRYGGNRNLVGWSLIGFPGAQRAYTPAEIGTEGTKRTPQSTIQLHPFNAGQEVHEGAVLPLSGSDPRTWEDAHRRAPATPVPTQPPAPTKEVNAWLCNNEPT